MVVIRAAARRRRTGSKVPGSSASTTISVGYRGAPCAPIMTLAHDSNGTNGRVCGCIGCGKTATSEIRHPEHGLRTVCDDHAAGYEVVTHL